MCKYKINEIFYSLQGEGLNTGVPSIFIRFAGCNANKSFKCFNFCDTDFKKFKEYTLQDLIEQLNNIKFYNCHNLVLTGGEPFLQLDVDILKELKQRGFTIAVETNGTLINKIHNLKQYIDCLTVSPKTMEFYPNGTELKLVYMGQSANELETYKYQSNFKYYYLQPCSRKNERITAAMCLKHNWRLSLQTQKILDIQ